MSGLGQLIKSGNISDLTAFLRSDLEGNWNNIPPDLHDRKIFLNWKITEIDSSRQKFNKVPIYPLSGKPRSGLQGSDDDRRQLTTFDEAKRAFKLNNHAAGIGIAMLKGGGVVALDIDKCVNPDGSIPKKIEDLTNLTYVEISPSGTGLRAFWWGEAADGKNHQDGFELFANTGFVTVTGRQTSNWFYLIGGDLPKLKPEQREIFERLSTAKINSVEMIPALKKAEQNDRVFQKLQELGFVERHCGNGKYSIVCPFEEEHSSEGTGGSADTAYFLRHTGGYTTGHFHCLHAHCANRTDNEYRLAIGISEFDLLLPQQSGFKAMNIPELLSLPSHRWLIKGLLPANGLCLLYGNSGSGKTFITLDLCFAVALGKSWQGKRVKQSAVIYVAAEGGGGLPNRIKAYQQHHTIDLSDAPFSAITCGLSLLAGDASKVIAACKEADNSGLEIGLVVLDTLNRSMGGGDENSSLDMGKYLSAAAQISEETGALVLIVHHSGKDVSKGARGHSSLRAAVNCELEVRRDGDVRILKVSKSRDGLDGEEFAFRLETLILGVDEDLEQITSCAVTEANVNQAASRQWAPKGVWQSRIYETVLRGGENGCNEIQLFQQIEQVSGGQKRWRDSVYRALKELLQQQKIIRTGDNLFFTLEVPTLPHT